MRKFGSFAWIYELRSVWSARGLFTHFWNPFQFLRKAYFLSQGVAISISDTPVDTVPTHMTTQNSRNPDWNDIWNWDLLFIFRHSNWHLKMLGWMTIFTSDLVRSLTPFIHHNAHNSTHNCTNMHAHKTRCDCETRGNTTYYIHFGRAPVFSVVVWNNTPTRRLIFIFFYCLAFFFFF